MTSKVRRPDFRIKYKYPPQIFLTHAPQKAMPAKMVCPPQGGSRNSGYMPYNKEYRALRGGDHRLKPNFLHNPKGFMPVGGSGYHGDGLKIKPLNVSRPTLRRMSSEAREKKVSTKQMIKKDQIEHDGDAKAGYQILDEQQAKARLKKEIALQYFGGQIFKDSGSYTGGLRQRYYQEHEKMLNSSDYLQAENDVFDEVKNLQDGQDKNGVVPNNGGM